jgi:hypothetical protein
MTEDIIITIVSSNGLPGIVSGTNPRRISVSAIDCLGKPGSGWLVGGILDVDASYRYITGMRSNGEWQVNRRDRSTSVVTSARPSNNPLYTFTSQESLRAARASLIYD